jgi:hypothetical protein
VSIPSDVNFIPLQVCLPFFKLLTFSAAKIESLVAMIHPSMPSVDIGQGRGHRFASAKEPQTYFLEVVTDSSTSWASIETL